LCPGPVGKISTGVGLMISIGEGDEVGIVGGLFGARAIAKAGTADGAISSQISKVITGYTTAESVDKK